MKIFCIGRNYTGHAKELNNPVPDKPIIFIKPPTSLLRLAKPFYIPDFSDDIHYETELVIKIIKNGKNIDRQFVRSYYDKMTVGIDFTARDIQRKLKEKGHPWELAKGFDFSAAIGDWIVFDGEKKRKNIEFSLNRNGSKVQIGNTKDMIFSIDEIIMYISGFFRVQVGDLIFTGTPAGVGRIKQGDVFEGFIEDEQLLYCEIR